MHTVFWLEILKRPAG